jgi:hypothetical protein
MSVCSDCFFWAPENNTDESANCIVDPPRVIPLMGMQEGKPKTFLQNIYPTTTRDTRECRFFDKRPRPVIKVAHQMPGQN